MILATDLDGTFLAGSVKARETLIERFLHTPDAQLLYVTGRSAASVEELIESGTLPRPHTMICDVGCDIVSATPCEHAASALEWIRQRWGNRGHAIHSALQDLSGLRMQERFGDYRLAYYYDDPGVLEQARAIVEHFGCDPLDSDGIYFDVLPPGVNKGATLRRLIKTRGDDADSVLVAGDTLNDLSMLSAGFRAVAVGGSEPDLLARLPHSPHIHRAKALGCDGIVEALHTFHTEDCPK